MSPSHLLLHEFAQRNPNTLLSPEVRTPNDKRQTRGRGHIRGDYIRKGLYERGLYESLFYRPRYGLLMITRGHIRGGGDIRCQRGGVILDGGGGGVLEGGGHIRGEGVISEGGGGRIRKGLYERGLYESLFDRPRYGYLMIRDRQGGGHIRGEGILEGRGSYQRRGGHIGEVIDG